MSRPSRGPRRTALLSHLEIPVTLSGMFLVLSVVPGCLCWYALSRAKVCDVPCVLKLGTQAMVVLGLGSMAMLLVDPADVPSVLRAVLVRF